MLLLLAINYHGLVHRLRLGGCTPCALSQKRNKFRSTFPSPKKTAESYSSKSSIETSILPSQSEKVVFVELLTGQADFHRDAGHCDGYTEEVLCRANKGPLREVC